MSSPSNDHYAGLMTPWKPIAVLPTKKVDSLRNRMEVDHGTQVSNLASILQHRSNKRQLILYRKETKLKWIATALALAMTIGHWSVTPAAL